MLLLALWQILSLSGQINPLILPAPTALFAGFLSGLITGELMAGLANSLLLISLAMVPSLIIAFLMALGAYRSPFINRICERGAALFHPLPGIALLPLFILWTGLGKQIIVLTVIHSVLWPFYVNTRAGFREVSLLWLDLGRNRELSEAGIFFHILIPGAYPYILSGLKVAWARAWRAVIAAEMVYGAIGGRGGMGWYIYQKRLFMDTTGMYGGILMLMITGLVVDRLLFVPLERGMQKRRGSSIGSA